MAVSLEKAIQDMKAVFKKYAAKEGNPNTLVECELKELFKTEITWLSAEKQNTIVEDIIRKDTSHDITFSEFMRIVAALVNYCESTGQCQKSSGCK